MKFTKSTLMGAGCVSDAKADVMYQYTGAEFTFVSAPFGGTTSQDTSGYFTSAPLGADLVDAAITPDSYEFLVGPTDYSQNSTIDQFEVSTDPSSDITSAMIKIDTNLGPPGPYRNIGPNGDNFVEVFGGPFLNETLASNSTAGVWTTTPKP